MPSEKRRLHEVSIRRVFRTSRELMAARSPDDGNHNRDGIAFTCDVCGRGGRTTHRSGIQVDGKCDCERIWMECGNDDCEQSAWTFVLYAPCGVHGRTRPDDIHATLLPYEAEP